VSADKSANISLVVPMRVKMETLNVNVTGDFVHFFPDNVILSQQQHLDDSYATNNGMLNAEWRILSPNDENMCFRSNG